MDERSPGPNGAPPPKARSARKAALAFWRPGPVGYPAGQRRSQLSADPLGGGVEPILEALGNLGDFIGGIAVVATLIYLAVQIRQNSRQLNENTLATRAAAYQSHLALASALNLESVRDRETAKWFFLTPDEVAALDPVDRLRWEILHVTYWRTHQHVYLQHESGLISEDLWRSHVAGLRRQLANPATRELWSQRRSEFSESFANLVDSLTPAPG